MIFIFIIAILKSCAALDNGLSLTPPMGWLSWLRYECLVDCKKFPNECISEKLLMNVADLMVSEGYAEVGYQYVIVDDCWLAKTRDSSGRLQPDPERFPCGIKALANYIQSKGLKFGIYENYGRRTCEGYPGTYLENLQLDAQTFADWEVDYVKLDACFTKGDVLDKGYSGFGRYLNKSGRPIVYSCSWPYYRIQKKYNPNLQMISKHCNLWRLYEDIHDSWESVKGVMNWFARYQDQFISFAGPGHWNDPDMIIIGNYGLSLDQSKAHMAIWAILAAPLIMSTDLSAMRPEFRDILQNIDIIAVDQDPLGFQGRRIIEERFISVWIKPVMPYTKVHYSYAIAFINKKEYGPPFSYSVSLRRLKLTHELGYAFKDLYSGEKFTLMPDGTLDVRVNPAGVVMYKASVIV